MNDLKTLVSTDLWIPYDGHQLSPHWIYRTFDVLGDAVVAFEGEADVPISQMVDLTDVKNNAPIRSPHMLHFIGEWFHDSLEVGILTQHLFVCVVHEALVE